MLVSWEVASEIACLWSWEVAPEIAGLSFRCGRTRGLSQGADSLEVASEIAGFLGRGPARASGSGFRVLFVWLAQARLAFHGWAGCLRQA